MAVIDTKSQAMCQSPSTVTSWSGHFHVEMGHFHICEACPHHPDITALNTPKNPALTPDAVLFLQCRQGGAL